MRSMEKLYDSLSQAEKERLEAQANLLREIWKKVGYEHFLTANEVLEIVYEGDMQIPIDPLYIAKHFGINVGEYSRDVQGLSQFDGQNIEIHYKPTNKNRDRFTVAHELGHIFLHFLEGKKFEFRDKTLKDGFTDLEDKIGCMEPVFIAARENTNNDDLEKEANVFAGELLVPKKEILKLKTALKSGYRYKSSALCRYFQVSNGTMWHTMRHYGLWDSMVADDYSW